MATVVSQHVPHLDRHRKFFKKNIFGKIAANFLEISRKHVFTASNRNIVKNTVRKKKLAQILSESYSLSFNPRSLLEKIVTRSLEGGQSDPPPSTFDIIPLIDLKFGSYDKLHLYFQLSKTTWCLIGFHDNNSQINNVTGGRHLGFSNF